MVLRDATADHDDLRVQDVDKRDADSADCRAGTIQDAGGGLVALVRNPGEQRGVELMPGRAQPGVEATSRLDELSASRASAVRGEALGHGRRRRSRRSDRRARHQVSYLASGAVHADERPAIDDRPAADTGRDGEVHDGARSTRGAVPPLGEHGRVRITLEKCGQADRLGDPRSNGARRASQPGSGASA